MFLINIFYFYFVQHAILHQQENNFSLCLNLLIDGKVESKKRNINSVLNGLQIQ